MSAVGKADSSHEKTAGAVGAAPGGRTPKKGIKMNTEIVSHGQWRSVTMWLSDHRQLLDGGAL